MKIKRLLLPALAVWAASGLTRRLFATRASAKPASTGASYEAIDAYVAEQMRRLNIPGASLAIVEGDRIVHRRNFGRARPGGDAPTTQTPFFIGSVGKSITALAVMQLVEAGKVELDAPVQRYLPWFRVADPRASSQTPALAPERSAGASVTVRHLLNQTSGLPMLRGEVALTEFDDRPDAAELQVRALATLKIGRPVGSKWEYSNLNYNVLGLIVEAAGGEPYAEYIQKHILNPLEMTHTYTDRAAAKRDGLAMGYRLWFGRPVPAGELPVPRGSLAAGQHISCAEDMAHYLIAHLNGGRYGDARVLSAAGIEELHRGVAEYRLGSIASGRYGMGWFEQDLDGIKTYAHGGNVPDFSAFIALVPEQKKGVTVLFNADPYGFPAITEEVGMGLTALLAGQEPGPMRLDFVRWIMRLLPLIPLLQVAGVVATLRRSNRWRRDPVLCPSGGRLWGQHILLPLVPNLSLAAILVYLRSGGLLRFLHLFMPDLAWIVRISGGFAAIWAFLRTGLILGAVRESPSPLAEWPSAER
jgi:CubicO group peptidase (beta-lactamase class C family)